MIYAVMQLIGGFILAFGWIPQIIQVIRTKSVADLSLKTFGSLVAGIGLMEVYAVHIAQGGVGIPFLITNTLSLMLMLIMIGCILKYRKRP